MVRRAFSFCFRWIPWLITGVAAVLLLEALNGQVEIQSDLGRAMTGVEQNLTEAVGLTGQTALALEPMNDTAQKLERMNQNLRFTTGEIRIMNEVMERITVKQERILVGLDGLNQRTGSVIVALADVEKQNQLLLTSTADLADETNGQGDSLERLDWLTGEAINYLGQINRRFSFLNRS